jgi:hypothetical protein
LIGTSLHGVAMASNEIVMTTINPIISVLHCTHESAHQPPSATVHADHRLETVTDALTRLASAATRPTSTRPNRANSPAEFAIER